MEANISEAVQKRLEKQLQRYYFVIDLTLEKSSETNSEPERALRQTI